MTRKEQIVQYAQSFDGKGMENEELKEVIKLAIIDGALWADAHPVKPSLPSDANLEEEIARWVPAHINVRTDKTLSINPTELAKICKEWGECIARHFAKWSAEQFAKTVRANLYGIGDYALSQIEHLYFEITGTKMFGGYNN